jgi:hypothetical protein
MIDTMPKQATIQDIGCRVEPGMTTKAEVRSTRIPNPATLKYTACRIGSRTPIVLDKLLTIAQQQGAAHDDPT